MLRPPVLPPPQQTLSQRQASQLGRYGKHYGDGCPDIECVEVVGRSSTMVLRVVIPCVLMIVRVRLCACVCVRKR